MQALRERPLARRASPRRDVGPLSLHGHRVGRSRSCRGGTISTRRVDPDDIALRRASARELDRGSANRAAAQRCRMALCATWAQQLARRRNDRTSDRSALRARRDAVAALRSAIPTGASQTVYAGRAAASSSIALRARFSAWYELFPRSTRADARTCTARSGTVEARLPYVARVGFDVLYLPPIHPIGRAQRKGRNNTLVAGPEDVGSPWAIGAAEGGHKAIHPAARHARRISGSSSPRARAQASRSRSTSRSSARPTTRTSKRIPQWFKRRPDGSVQYAENPPKKYQDIYPFNFETDDWQALWEELDERVRRSGSSRACTSFASTIRTPSRSRSGSGRSRELKRDHPELHLPRGGVHATEGDAPPREARLHAVVHVLHVAQHQAASSPSTSPSLRMDPAASTSGPNAGRTRPTSCPSSLQIGGRAAFMARLVLAATLAANYGIYGPAFELLEHDAARAGQRGVPRLGEVRASRWDLERPGQPRGIHRDA